uniref:Uncharacterized protein n=1 Tax=Quercus lobata TaxID=97700 RepID=A0A7N2L4U1_QUELO
MLVSASKEDAHGGSTNVKKWIIGALTENGFENKDLFYGSSRSLYAGFLPVEALISKIEVWGLGGKAAKEVQSSYRKREELFTEQRRKVDLKTFGSWDESPEKMMMDMISDPNAVRREDR